MQDAIPVFFQDKANVSVIDNAGKNSICHGAIYHPKKKKGNTINMFFLEFYPKAIWATGFTIRK